MIFKIDGRSEKRDDGVALKLVDRTFVLHDNVGHLRQIFIQQNHQLAGGLLL